MNIGAVTNTVTKAAKLTKVERIIQRGANSGFVQNMVKKHASDPNFYPNFVLGLIVLQNLIGTATYTYASWTNKGMPPEQRKFAAAIDFMNGVFNFGVILTIGRLINNNSDKWAESVAKVFKNLKDKAGYDAAKTGFRSFLTIVVAGVFVQRVIVPFLATPCAKWFKEKYLSGDKMKDMKINPDRKFIYSEKLSQEAGLRISDNDPYKSFKVFESGLNKLV